MMFNTMSPREALHQLPTDVADIVVGALTPPAPR
jgi:hypothetical protein